MSLSENAAAHWGMDRVTGADLDASRPGGMADEAIMLAVRSGDVGQLSTLFERHHRQLFNYFYRLTGNRDQSEDLVQDVFFRLLKYRESYQPKTSFVAWMYQVGRNALIDGYRKRKSEAAWSDDRPEPASSDAPMDAQIGQKQEIDLLRRALAALPPEKREVLVLSRYQNLKYEEIGQILGCEVGAVKLRVFRAVRALGQAFAEISGAKA